MNKILQNIKHSSGITKTTRTEPTRKNPCFCFANLGSSSTKNLIDNQPTAIEEELSNKQNNNCKRRSHSMETIRDTTIRRREKGMNQVINMIKNSISKKNLINDKSKMQIEERRLNIKNPSRHNAVQPQCWTMNIGRVYNTRCSQP